MGNIKRLSESEKEFAVKEIVQKGLVRPQDRLRKMLEVWRVCTLRTLFFGVGDCLFLGLLAAACLWLFLVQAGSQVMVCMVFAVSPFAYMVCYLLTAWKEYRLQLYEIKMTCRYTFRQVSAFRMIYFSGFNIVLNGVILAFLVQYRVSAAYFWKMLGISFAAVFLYGVIMLAVQIKGRPRVTGVLPPVLWGTINMVVIAFYGERVEGILLNLAGGLVACGAVVIFAVYLMMLFLFFQSGIGEEEPVCCQ